MRTRWRFGLNRRFVATIEWLLLCPNAGAFPQIAQTFDMSTAEYSERSCARSRTQAREQVGHLERRESRFRALVSLRASRPFLRLLTAVAGENAEGDGNPGLEPGELEPAGGLAGDVLEVRRVAAAHE